MKKKCSFTTSGKHVWWYSVDDKGLVKNFCNCLECVKLDPVTGVVGYFSRCIKDARICEYCGLVDDSSKEK